MQVQTTMQVQRAHRRYPPLAATRNRHSSSPLLVATQAADLRLTAAFRLVAARRVVPVPVQELPIDAVLSALAVVPPAVVLHMAAVPPAVAVVRHISMAALPYGAAIPCVEPLEQWPPCCPA